MLAARMRIASGGGRRRNARSKDGWTHGRNLREAAEAETGVLMFPAFSPWSGILSLFAQASLNTHGQPTLMLVPHSTVRADLTKLSTSPLPMECSGYRGPIFLRPI
jgi:hypothetical protein